MDSQIITPVVKKSATTNTHDISVVISDINMRSLSGVVGEYMTQQLVKWNGKRFYMRIYRAGMDATSNGCISLSFHVDTTDYEVPLVVSFHVDLKVSTTLSSLSTLSKPNFTFSPAKQVNYVLFNTTIQPTGYLRSSSCDVTLSIQLWQPPLEHNLSTAVAAIFDSAISGESVMDVTIIADEGTVHLPAMRSLLCARSAVFKAMLPSGGGGMSESLSREITIPDFDSLVLRAMLRYIHTDMVNLTALDDHHADSLYVAANKYQIKGLLQICEDFMKATMNGGNCSRRLLLFNTLNRMKMKIFALQYFKDHAMECAGSKTLAEDFGVPLCKEVIRVLAGAKG